MFTVRLTRLLMLSLAVALLPQSSAVAEKMKLIYHYAGHGGVMSESQSCEAAVDIGANAIVKLSPSNGDMASLERFLNTAAEYDLDVLVMTNRGKEPYKTDLAGWSKCYAELSLKYPNLIGWTLVDFLARVDPNKPETFAPSSWRSPAAVREATRVKNAINPKLRFLPELYYDAHLKTGELVYFEKDNPYAGTMDGAQFFVWACYSTRTKFELNKLDQYLTSARQIVPPVFYTTGVYVTQGGAYKSPDMADLFYSPDTDYKMVRMSLDRSPGVTVYALNGPLLAYYDTKAMLGNANWFAQPKNDDAAFDFKLGLRQHTVMGWYQEVATDISLPLTISEAKLSFKIKDNRRPKEEYAQKFAHKQILVDDHAVWEKDIYSDGTQTDSVSQDLTQQLAGRKHARISIRMQAKARAFAGDSVYVGDISLTVNGKPVETAFHFQSGIRDFNKWVATYQAVKRALHEDSSD